MHVASADVAGFEAAYATHYRPIRAFAARLVGDPAVGEEVAQDVFLWFWANPEKYEPARGSIGAFLMAATRGRAIDRLRADGARRRREERGHHDRAAVATAERSAEVDAFRSVRAREVRDALGALPRPEREAIALAYFGGHTYREAAALLGQPEGTVKSRIRSGLVRLRAGVA